MALTTHSSPNCLPVKNTTWLPHNINDRPRGPYLNFILYSVSASGTKLCFYKYTKYTEQLGLERILGHTKIVVDTAPKEPLRRGVNMSTAKGEQQFRDVIFSNDYKGN